MRVSERPAAPTLYSLVVEIFLWHVVLREFSCRNFRHIRVGRALDTANDARLEGLPFFQEFFHTLRIRLGGIWYPLGIPGLPSRFSFEIAVRFVVRHEMIVGLCESAEHHAALSQSWERKRGNTL